MAGKKIVIVGGGAGGLPLATRLGRRLGRHGLADITLVDGNSVHVWKPRFHEVATGAIDADLDAVDYRQHARLNHYRFAPGTLTGVQPEAGQITLAAVHDAEGGEVLPERKLDYDYLVLAVGSRSNDFNIPGIREHCLFLDTRQQADRFRERFLNACLNANHNNAPLSVAIVGAGATGVELAAEIHHAVAMLKLYGHEQLDRRNLTVHLIEAAPRILPALTERVSTAAHERLEKMGVQVHTGTTINQAEAGALHVRDGDAIKADLLVWVAGVKAPDMLAGIPGIATNRINQIEVDEYLRNPSHPNILVIGDCAALTLPGTDRPLPPRAQAAQQMARQTAANLERLITGQEPRPFHYHDHGSLVSLSKYSSVGSLMGNLKGGSFFIEGWLARIMYISLYRLHQAALYGWPRTLLLLLAGRFSKLVRPRMKLH